ncbi:MAG: GNAT family N-acetyltransferase [Candidatus Korobacteraceae bacterium]
MPEIQATATQSLPDFVDLEFARRLEMAETVLPDCVEALRRYDPATPCEAETVAGGVAFFGGQDYPANQMVGMGLYGEVTAQDMDRVEHFFRSRGVPSTIVVSPLSDMSLPALLGERGYRVAEFNSVLIRRISAEEPFTAPAGIVIERATRRNVSSWTHTLAKGFSQEVTVGEDVFGGFATLPGALAFLARIDGEAAGGCAGRIISEARIAALFGASTLPEFRGRGVQSALIARRLHEASKAGCEYAVVSTNPGSGSQRNMERRGFRVAYTKVVMMREWPEIPSGGMP